MCSQLLCPGIPVSSVHECVKGERYLFCGPSAISKIGIGWSLLKKQKVLITPGAFIAGLKKIIIIKTIDAKLLVCVLEDKIFLFSPTLKDYYCEEGKKYKMGRRWCV